VALRKSEHEYQMNMDFLWYVMMTQKAMMACGESDERVHFEVPAEEAPRTPLVRPARLV